MNENDRKTMFSSAKDDWQTPNWLMDFIKKWWWIDTDIAPTNHTEDSLADDYRWKGYLFCNPPYGRNIQTQWVDKCIREFELDKYNNRYFMKPRQLHRVVFLLPARTDTKWFEMCLEYADEIVFIKGRLKFKGAKSSAPFPSILVIFTGDRIYDCCEQLVISGLDTKGKFTVYTHIDDGSSDD